MKTANSSQNRLQSTEKTTAYPQVDRRSRLTLKEFSREYRRPGKPVVIVDAIDNWRARSDWTFDFFKTRYGADPVLVYRFHGDKYRPRDAQRMSLAEYVDGVKSKDWESFPFYVRDNWGLLAAHPELAADYQFPKYFFDWYTLLPGFMRLPYPRIFIGPKGAVTPLHMDIWKTHAWLSQLVGRKRWLLFPPEQDAFLYNYRVDPNRPDLEQFPLYRQARPMECVIGPGETVFVPSGWAHWVESLDATISLSSNYMGPGCFGPAFSNAARELVFKRAWKAFVRRVRRPRPVPAT
jgi:hypothetical protein